MNFGHRITNKHHGNMPSSKLWLFAKYSFVTHFKLIIHIPDTGIHHISTYQKSQSNSSKKRLFIIHTFTINYFMEDLKKDQENVKSEEVSLGNHSVLGKLN